MTSLAPLLTLAEWHEGPALGAADLAALPATLRSWALAHGVLGPIECLLEIACPACGTHAVSPSDELIAWCTADGGRERLTLAADDLRAWEFRIEALAEALAVALTDVLSTAATARIAAVPIVPGRIAFVGTTRAEAGSFDLFVARGLNWPDASMILSTAQRLRRSPRPAVLSLTRLASLDVWSAMKPAVGILAECAAIDARGLVMDIGSLVAQQPVPSPAASAPAWLTVKEAAVQLMDVVSGLDHDRAMARVSRAASDGKFRTNGKTRMYRRIDRDSFSHWLLEQRRRDLSNADAWSSGR